MQTGTRSKRQRFDGEGEGGSGGNRSSHVWCPTQNIPPFIFSFCVHPSPCFLLVICVSNIYMQLIRAPTYSLLHTPVHFIIKRSGLSVLPSIHTDCHTIAKPITSKLEEFPTFPNAHPLCSIPQISTPSLQEGSHPPSPIRGRGFWEMEASPDSFSPQ